jgi:SAM-dependent methyltransferase
MKFRIPDYPKRILDIPVVYTVFQSVVGYSKFVSLRVSALVNRYTGQTIIDLGCGPCDLLADLQIASHYFGIDLHGPFIQRAQFLFPSHAKRLFEASIVDFDYTTLEVESESVVVLALGLLHHLNDSDIQKTLSAVKKLDKKITLFSIDPVLFDGQNAWSRFLANSDRGQFVRKDSVLQTLMVSNEFMPESISIDNKALNTKMHLMIATWVYEPS